MTLISKVPLEGIVQVNEGQDVALRCEVLGLDDDDRVEEIQWRKEGFPFPGGHYTYDGDEYPVVNASKSDAGYYFCSIRTVKGLPSIIMQRYRSQLVTGDRHLVFLVSFTPRQDEHCLSAGQDSFSSGSHPLDQDYRVNWDRPQRGAHLLGGWRAQTQDQLVQGERGNPPKHFCPDHPPCQEKFLVLVDSVLRF